MVISDFQLHFDPILRIRSLHKIRKIIVHCSATDILHSVEDVHDWHKKRGWSGCGYHFFITKDGEIQRGRPISTIGSHCKGHNSGSIGICLAGLKEFKQPQVESFLELKDFLEEQLPNPVTYHPHNEFSPKTCPNVLVPDLLRGVLSITA